MNHDARLKLQIGMYRASLLNIDFVDTPSFQTVDGVWQCDTATLQSHPLEAALLGQPSTGDWKADIGRQLGVSGEWIQGFMDGYAGNANNDYARGLIDGTTVRLLQHRVPFVFFEFDVDELSGH